MIIKSTSYSQAEILNSIITLYCPVGFDLDPTYSKGNFYKEVPEPKYKSDLFPKLDGVMECDCRNLPFDDGELRSIVFDPPFITGVTTDKSIIGNRFSWFKNMGELMTFYYKSLEELYRILAKNGILVFKCQDAKKDHQWFVHVDLMNYAKSLGLETVDLFILLAKSRLIAPNIKKQQAVRKFHSYFLVFKKL